MFRAANPNIEVNVTAKSGEYFELLQAMIADAAAGNPLPDVFVGGYNLLNYIATELKPTPVEELSPSTEELNAFLGRFKDGMMELAQYDGKQTGTLASLPVIIVYLFFQRNIIDAFISSGIKG